jgi:membrane-bound serine protease (ClpP class)
MAIKEFQAMKRFLLAFMLLVPFAPLLAQKTRVMVMEIKSEIDPRTNRYVELALKYAEETKADIVIIEMDTYGGILTDAKEVVDKIMDFKNQFGYTLILMQHLPGR